MSSDAQHAGIIGERYEILSTLGQGGMGVVLKARHLKLSKIVAIKVLSNSLITDDASRTRFEIEAQAGSKHNHPHLISVFDYGYTQAGEPYLVMEYIDGSSGIDDTLPGNPDLSAKRQSERKKSTNPILIVFMVLGALWAVSFVLNLPTILSTYNRVQSLAPELDRAYENTRKELNKYNQRFEEQHSQK